MQDIISTHPEVVDVSRNHEVVGDVFDKQKIDVWLDHF